MNDGIEVQREDEGITIADVQQVVDGTRGEYDERLSSMSEELRGLSDSVSQLRSPEPAEGETSAQVVQISPSQVDTAKEAIRIGLTEGLICIVLLAALLGVQLFRLFSAGWRRG